MITANEIRNRFLEFFQKQGHEIVRSSPLVPKDDPSLFFTNAGMVQFKKTFLGQEKRPYKRATTSQKCLRISGKHNDLENVGRTARHHTFFEMLGNFSFGDYFKAEAIRFAWTFITEELKLPKDKLYVTIFTDDDEAEQLWLSETDVAPERIYRLGEKENFWSMGDTGPCGPCSEIHIDQGEHMSCGPGCGLGKCDCDRFLEIWNLVFMQFDQIEPGNRVPLPRPSIDTGMGLERIAAVCQGVFSNYDTDLFQEIIQFTAKMAGVKYKEENDDVDTALRVIADHSRAATFLLADGVMPSNEGRGYELRRLIRRALRFGNLIGQKDAFLYRVCDTVIGAMGDAYPEIVDKKEFILSNVREEEERFGRTLVKGLEKLTEELDRMVEAKEKVVSGEFTFKLYDTFGFPLDIVRDVAEKKGFPVDEPGFNTCMEEQRQRAKANWKGSGEIDLGAQFKALLEAGVTSTFVGYDSLKAESKILSLIDEEGNSVDKLAQGQGGFAVCAVTPFYGESGGQAGDKGQIFSMTGSADVLDALKPASTLTMHKIFVNEGDLAKGQDATLEVDEELRTASARNHTTTHLLHAALRQVLGAHVNQAGSLVGPDRLRFDFSNNSPMTDEQILAVEELVNKSIMADAPVDCQIMSHDAAMEKGATALFGEKYGDEVRVVEVPGFSMELCGGTHLARTGQAGSFTIFSETGVAAGVRRIEAATGANAMAAFQAQRAELDSTAKLLKSKPSEVSDKVKALQKEVKAQLKEIEKLQARLLSGESRSLMDEVEEIGGIKVLAVKVDVPSVKVLREQMDDIRSKMSSGVALLAAPQDGGKVMLIMAVSKDLHDRFTAPGLIREIVTEVGGTGGGGRPDLAQTGGSDSNGIPKAIAKLKAIIKG
ncbi:MAG: alanine--tRNA ligase [Desulfovibrio sp.]|uniref:alanine--tRNA ligase n=1 Tax=Desulfovibrio sp. 7SRBS1 TaxID=3378064 RepID=UPI003B3F0215